MSKLCDVWRVPFSNATYSLALMNDRTPTTSLTQIKEDQERPGTPWRAQERTRQHKRNQESQREPPRAEEIQGKPRRSQERPRKRWRGRWGQGRNRNDGHRNETCWLHICLRSASSTRATAPKITFGGAQLDARLTIQDRPLT